MEHKWNLPSYWPMYSWVNSQKLCLDHILCDIHCTELFSLNMLCESQVYDTKNFTLVSNLDSTRSTLLSYITVYGGKDKVTVLVESYRFYGIKLPFLFHKVTVFGPKLPFIGDKVTVFSKNEFKTV